jgi:hypothetical protein
LQSTQSRGIEDAWRRLRKQRLERSDRAIAVCATSAAAAIYRALARSWRDRQAAKDVLALGAVARQAQVSRCDFSVDRASRRER